MRSLQKLTRACSKGWGGVEVVGGGPATAGGLRGKDGRWGWWEIGVRKGQGLAELARRVQVLTEGQVQG